MHQDVPAAHEAPSTHRSSREARRRRTPSGSRRGWRRATGVVLATGTAVTAVAAFAPSAQAGIGGAPDHNPVPATWTRPSGVVQWGHLTAADLDGDGNDEVLAGDHDGTIWALRAATGTPLWTVRTPGGVAVDAPITVVDTDGDGTPEVYSGLGSLYVQQQSGGLVSYTNTGQQRWLRQFGDVFSNWSPAWGTRPDGFKEITVTAPQVGDVDGDGRTDLVVAPQDNRVYVLDPATGADRSWWNDPRQDYFPGSGYWVDDAVFSTPLVADIDSDGRDEIVVGVASTPGGPVDVSGGVLLAIELENGAPRTKWTLALDDIVGSPPVLADLDQDGTAEIVVGSGYDYAGSDTNRRDWRRVHVVDPRTGTRKWFTDTNGATFQQPAVADLDGDGRPEIIQVTDPKPSGDGRVHVIRHDGTVRWATAPATCFPGVGCEGGGGMIAGAIVGDVDGDGDQDVLASTGWAVYAIDGRTGNRIGSAFANGRIHQATPVIARSGGQRYLVTNSFLDGSGLWQAFRLPSSPVADAWPQWRYDADHTGIRTAIGRYVGIEPTASGNGYWRVTDGGTVVAHGDARHFGDEPVLRIGERVASMSATPNGDGYWLFTNRGRVFPYGSAQSYGDMGAVQLNGPVLDSQVTPTGRGYYMVASDGGVFAFGDASFAGSMGGRRLNQPVESLVPDPDGRGYWLVASDGGVFAFEAGFVGSIPGVLRAGQRLNAPVSGMVPYGNGYVLVATDGGAFVFSNLPFYGSRGDNPPAAPVLDVATTNGGYWMLTAAGEVLGFGSARTFAPS